MTLNVKAAGISFTAEEVEVLVHRTKTARWRRSNKQPTPTPTPTPTTYQTTGVKLHNKYLGKPLASKFFSAMDKGSRVANAKFPNSPQAPTNYLPNFGRSMSYTRMSPATVALEANKHLANNNIDPQSTEGKALDPNSLGGQYSLQTNTARLNPGYSDPILAAIHENTHFADANSRRSKGGRPVLNRNPTSWAQPAYEYEGRDSENTAFLHQDKVQYARATGNVVDDIDSSRKFYQWLQQKAQTSPAQTRLHRQLPIDTSYDNLNDDLKARILWAQNQRRGLGLGQFA